MVIDKGALVPGDKQAIQGRQGRPRGCSAKSFCPPEQLGQNGAAMTPPPSEPLPRVPSPPRDVETWPCQSICVWSATGETWLGRDGDALPVFCCAGCGSEWVRTEPWTPVDATGVVPAEVAAERARDRI